jgi:hypothetical protein
MARSQGRAAHGWQRGVFQDCSPFEETATRLLLSALPDFLMDFLLSKCSVAHRSVGAFFVDRLQ